jgi:hypothetical protein
MPRSSTVILVAALFGVVAGVPSEATAQVRVSLQWNGLHAGGPYVHAEFGARGAYVVGSFAHSPQRYRSARPRKSYQVRHGVRIPPGHLPGPGQCRVWYPNRPPGHQPAPFRCSERYHDPYASYGYGTGRGHFDGPRAGDPIRYGPVRTSPEYLEDPRVDQRLGSHATTRAPGRIEAGARPADVGAQRRWAALGRQAQELREGLKRRGRGDGR